MSSLKDLKDRETTLKGEIEISTSLVPAAITAGNKRNAKGLTQKFREQINDINLVFSSILGKTKAEDKPTTLAAISKFMCEAETKYTECLDQYDAKFPEEIAHDPVDAQKDARVAVIEASIKEKTIAVKGTVTTLCTNVEKEPKDTRLSRVRYQCYMDSLEQAKNSLKIDLKSLLDELLKLQPDKAAVSGALIDDAEKTFVEKRTSLMFSLTAFEVEPAAMLTSTPDQSMLHPPPSQPLSTDLITSIVTAVNASNTQSSTTQKSKYKYDKDKPPIFNGQYEEFPEWMDEWETCVMPGENDTWLLRTMNKCTPKCDDLTIFSTSREAMDHMKGKYANPIAVSNSLIKKFVAKNSLPGRNDDQKLIQLHYELQRLHHKLKVNKQEEQLTQSSFIVQHAMELLPSKFYDRLSDKRKVVKAQMGESAEPQALSDAKLLWKVLRDFLEEERETIASFRPHNLDLGSLSSQPPTSGSKKVNQVQNSKNKQSKGSSTPSNYNQIGLSKDTAMKDKQVALGSCPACARYHVWKGNNGDQPSAKFSDCPTWRGLSQDEKVDTIVKSSGCTKCTSWKHQTSQCTARNFRCFHKDSNGDICGKPHHIQLHGNSSPHVINLLSLACDHDQQFPVLMHLVDVTINDKVNTVIFMDGGSSCSIITHDLANSLGLKGRFTREWVQLMGKQPELMDTKWYNFTWYLPEGQVKTIRLLGIEFITSNLERVDISLAYDLFPQVPAKALDRPTGSVGILLGQDNCSLLPFGGEDDFQVDDLRVMRVKFGSGYVLGGTHPDLKFKPIEYTNTANLWRNATFWDRPSRSINKVIKVQPFTCMSWNQMDFFAGEEVGLNVPKKCRRCLACPHCTFQDDSKSIQDHFELMLLKDAIKYDHEDNVIRVSYPIVGDIDKLTDNRQQAMKRCSSLITSLKKRKLLEAYQGQVADYVHRGVWKETSEAEIEAWKAKGGKVHYVSYHCVLNDHSASTPVRVVVDSKMPNNYTGPSPNDLWPKGPNSLNNLYTVLIRFRSYLVGLVYDLEKA